MGYTYKYPRPAVTVDCVVFGLGAAELQVLLVQRDREPFRNAWALPGGFLQLDETPETAARRELEEETGIDVTFLEQLYTFGEVKRDPRGRTISITYWALVRPEAYDLQSGSDAADAQWHALSNLPQLAFDHHQMIATARQRLENRIAYQPIGFDLLPTKFPLRDLQLLYEVILGRELDKRNFRKRVLGLGILKELDESEAGVAHRAARLYRFDRKAYEKRCREGLGFKL